MKKRYVLKNKKKFMIFIFILSFILSSVIMMFTVTNAYEYNTKRNVSVTVVAGDTLWTIADSHNDGIDLREYIYELKKLNNLDDSTIRTGQKLILPN